MLSKLLRNSVAPKIRDRGRQYFRKGLVAIDYVQDDEIGALVTGSRLYDVRVEADAGKIEVHLSLYGLYNAENAVAAAAAATALGVPLARLANALSTVLPPPGRGEVHQGEDTQLTLVDDSYNSSPEALEALLRRT